MEQKTGSRDGQHQLSLNSSTNFNPAQPLHLHFTLPGIGAAGLALFWGIDSFIVKGLSFLIWSPSSLPTWCIFSSDVQSSGKRGFTIALNAFFVAASKLFRNFSWYYHYLCFSVLPQNCSISQLRLLGRIRKQVCILGWQNWKSFCCLPLWVTVMAFAFRKSSQLSHFSGRVTFCSKMPANKYYWGRGMRW